MNILDRYIIRLYLLNLVILFLVLIGLIVMLDLIINFDEFAQAVEDEKGSWWDKALLFGRVAVEFYGPLILQLYVYIVGLVTVAGAGFTLTLLIRNRELTAMLAGGVSMYRVAMPILVIGFAANVLMWVDQEYILPRLARQLSRSHADIKREGTEILRPLFVPDAQGRLFTAARFNPETNTMRNVTILVRGKTGRALARITAKKAIYSPQRHGWRLIEGYAVTRWKKKVSGSLSDSRNRHPSGATASDQRESAVPRRAEHGRLRYAPLAVAPSRANHARRGRPVAFIPSNLTPMMLLLREKSEMRQLLSADQLRALIRKAQMVDVAELKLILHSRFSLPVVNMLILMMGLPFFLLRAPRNLMGQSIRAACATLPAWAGGWVMLQITPQALPPAAIAWLPVALYLPVAVWLMDSVKT